MTSELWEQLVQARVLYQYFVRQTPCFGKQSVPDAQATVGGKNRDGFKQVIECRSPDAEQSIARAGQLGLLGAVLKD